MAQQFDQHLRISGAEPGVLALTVAQLLLPDLSGPIQLHHTRGDETVPVEVSEILYEQGLDAGMPIELVTYPGDNHNISGNFGTAISHSVAFFDRWLKQPANLAESDEPRVYTGAGLANLRGGPGTSFEIVGQECSRARACPSSAATSTAPGGRCKQPRAGLGVVKCGAGGEGGEGADRRRCGGWGLVRSQRACRGWRLCGEG